MRLCANGFRDSSGRGFRSIRISCLFFLALATATMVANPTVCPAAGSAAGNLIFILDASGSMGAQVQGKIKMDAAKEVMADLIRDLPAGINVGLVVYGHREKSDCSDVEELTPLGPLDKDDLTQQIMAISPKGKTPITISVRTVAEGLSTLEDETTIVLLSDGEETCEGDPCALVKELKASGIKFVMHVIGFDVGDKEKAQLACIAAAGEGFYLTAKNAGELSAAAKKAIEKTELSAGKLKITALRNGKPFRAYYEIFRPVQDEENDREQVADGWTDPEGASFSLVPGVYDIMVLNEEDSGSQPVVINGVTVEAGKSIEKVADFTGGTLKVRALRNGKPFRAYCSVRKTAAANEEDEKEQVADGWTDPEGTSFKLAPGVYDVMVTNEEDSGSLPVALTGVTVEAGKSIEKVADFTGGTLKIRALRNGKPFRAYCDILKPASEEGSEKQKISDGWTELEGIAFKLPPGVYEVKVTDEEDSGSTPVVFPEISIEAGKITEKTAEFSGGTLKVKVQKNGKPLRAYCDIFKPATEERTEKQKISDSWTDPEGTAFKVAPGTYDVAVENADTGEKKEVKGIAVEANKIQTVEVQF